jgi:ribokinase
MKEVFILGSMNMDLTAYAARFPQPGETLKGHDFHTSPGGKGLNQAVAAAKSGATVHFLGAIGADAFGQEMTGLLKAINVDVTSLAVRKDIASGIAMITVIPGDNQIVLDLGANETITVKEIDAFLSKAHPGDIFLAQGENNFEATAYSLRLAHEKGLFCLLNPAPASLSLKECFPDVTALLPNETEEALLSGGLLPHEAYPLFNVPYLLVTLGKHGYFVEGETGFKTVPALAVNVVDTTGAGDAFCGALASFLSREIPFEKAAEMASIYASLSTTKKGTSVAMPTLQEYRGYLEDNRPEFARLFEKK